MLANYKMFNSNKPNNCESCEQITKKNNWNQINNNMKEIINLPKTNLSIENYNSLSKNKLFNNTNIEYYGNNKK